MASPTSQSDGRRRRDPIADAAERGGRVFDLGMRAYLWGYPAVVTARTRNFSTDPSRDGTVPQNTLSHGSKLYDHRDRLVVKPNNDTLYSGAWVDLSQGSVTLTVPPVDRYHSFQFMDAYTNTWAYVGSRTTGSDGGTYILVGPGAGNADTGSPDEEVQGEVLRSPTDHVWLLGRTLVDGPDDLDTAIRIIHSYTLSGPRCQISMRHSPALSPHDLADSGLEFFDELSDVLQSDPPPAHDRELVDALAEIGVSAGGTPSTEITDELVRNALGASVKAAHEWLVSYGGNSRAAGWRYSTRLGDYGRNYLLRASTALRGLGALTADEAIYPNVRLDDAGERLSGAETYVLHFAADELPPVSGGGGFWSLTMYDEENFLVDNPIDRYSIGDRTPGISYGADGSLDIIVSRDQPGEVANWLPAPDGPFEITMRCYLPTGALLAGDYVVPGLHKR